MKRIPKKIIIIFITAAVLLAASRLFFLKKTFSLKSKESSTNEKLILGFSQIGSESAWRSRNTESIFEAAEKNGIQIIFKDAQQKQENQLKAIRSFIVCQVDVIAFVPIIEDGWDNVLQEAKDAGIPVILVDRQIKSDPSLYAGFIGENGIEEGKKAAEFLCRKFSKPHYDNSGRTGSKITPKKEINILELSGTHHSSVVIERAEGFRNVIKNHPEFKITATIDGDFLRSRGAEITENLIRTSVLNGQFRTDGLYYNNKKIDAIYSHNDSMTLGLLETIGAYGINTESTVIISIDAEQKSIDALKEGRLNCVVECNPNLGPILMELVKQIAEQKKIPRTTYIEETVFTEDDDFSKYTPRGY